MSTAHRETTTMTDTGSSNRAVRALRHALSNVFARVYLVAVVLMSGWAVVVTLGDNPDASFAGVVPVIATLPVSLLVLLPPDNWSMIFLPVALGALVNATVIGWCARALNRSRTGSGPSS
ncbi:SCO4225 family membrane protein [Streptomyces sp. NPDC058155]|uniref:SCO4225 family membrane protein n=1 Tax=Streptomyces sp. NPDC058155 TaxID=3346359 RepID=UPI0036ED7B56